MNENITPLYIAFISGGFMLLGSLITAVITYQIHIKNKDGKIYKNRLIQAYKDIIALRQLEEMYSVSIANDFRINITPLGVKRSYRALLRESGAESPSENTTILRANRELKRLTSE